jgi:hypothetical protein
MTDFDIRLAVRGVINETDLESPEEIAAKVAEQVPPRQLRSVLSLVLRDFVRVELGRSRRGAEQDVAASVHLSQHEPTEQQPPPPHVPSAKRAAIVEYAQRWLRQRVSVADEWKMVGDCTAADCEAIADEREQNAARNAAAALLWRARAELLRQHKAARLADLPVPALTEAEGRDAA